MKCDATLASSPFVHLFFFLLCYIYFLFPFLFTVFLVLLLLRDNDDENDLYPNVCEHVARKHNDFMMFFQHHERKKKLNYSWICIYTNEVPLLSNAIQHNHYYMNDHWDSVSFFYVIIFNHHSQFNILIPYSSAFFRNEKYMEIYTKTLRFSTQFSQRCFNNTKYL